MHVTYHVQRQGREAPGERPQNPCRPIASITAARNVDPDNLSGLVGFRFPFRDPECQCSPVRVRETRHPPTNRVLKLLVGLPLSVLVFEVLALFRDSVDQVINLGRLKGSVLKKEVEQLFRIGDGHVLRLS